MRNRNRNWRKQHGEEAPRQEYHEADLVTYRNPKRLWGVVTKVRSGKGKERSAARREYLFRSDEEEGEDLPCNARKSARVKEGGNRRGIVGRIYCFSRTKFRNVMVEDRSLKYTLR